MEQARAGALIFAPWGPTVHPDEPLALLTVRNDGRAHGCLRRPAWFMPLRGQRASQASRHERKARWKQAGEPSADRYTITVTPDGQDIRLG